MRNLLVILWEVSTVLLHDYKGAYYSTKGEQTRIKAKSDLGILLNIFKSSLI